ncbi:MAG: glycosyl hydrolase, partial [Gammaproteobacteria bacterium]
DALWVSRDGAKNFSKLHTPHGDNHIVWINPDDPSVLLEGNDGGATVSTDSGKTWSTEHNQPTGQFYHVALDDQFPFHIYGAQQDEGSTEGPSATPDGMIRLGDWKGVAYGESTFIAPKPREPNVTFGAGYYSIMMRYDSDTGQYRGISPWPNYQEGASAGELKYRFGWTHPILFSVVNKKELLAASQYVLKSTDEGAQWTRISPDLTRNDPSTEMPSGGEVDLDQSGAELFPDISALAVSPLDGKEIWAGSADGLVHITTDGGKHWHDITPKGLPQWAQISSIEPSHVAKDTAYLTASRYMWDDFHPYVFETSDYGKHWEPLSNGIPDDDYAFVIRQDPSDAKLLFLGTKNTVFTSFDGGGHWQPLSLNLPRVQVRDLKIDTRQGALVAATHGRAFWVLDNLTLLEQMTKQAAPGAEVAQVYAPQTAWLTHAAGASEYAKRLHDAGTNPPFGATVFFQIPAGYDGKTPVSLSFLDDKGKVVRSFDLHLKTKQPEPADTVKDNLKPTQRKAQAEEKLTAVSPGMNRFQWNLRYSDAVEVKGFEAPIAAGGEADEVDGPEAMPGRYRVVLNYGGHKSEQTFEVALDPRLHPARGGLAAQFELQMQIHDALDSLDQTLNQAIALRDQLTDAIGKHTISGQPANDAVAQLTMAINGLVQLDIQASEGDLLHETKLRSHLAYLASDVGLAYEQPTAAQYAVFKELDAEARAGIKQLQGAIADGKKVL